MNKEEIKVTRKIIREMKREHDEIEYELQYLETKESDLSNKIEILEDRLKELLKEK